MAYQLIYTSAPRLLQAGRTGFGTVAKHPEIRGALQSEIERFSQFSRQEGLNLGRVVIQYRCLSLSGEDFHVISRIKDAGADYTGRTNHIAHHIVFTAAEALTASDAGVTPADVIFSGKTKNVWLDSWSDDPRELGPEEELDVRIFAPKLGLPAACWESITGTPATAAILAPGRLAESCWVLYSQEQAEHILILFGESLLLHPAPWRISFANEIQPTDRVEDIAWRGIPVDSPLCGMAAQSVRPTLDLTTPAELPAPVAEFVELATFGTILPDNKLHPEPPTARPLPRIPGVTIPLTHEESASETRYPRDSFDHKKPAFHPANKISEMKQRRQDDADDKRRVLVKNLSIIAAALLVALAGGGYYVFLQSQERTEHQKQWNKLVDASERFNANFPNTEKLSDDLRTSDNNELKVMATILDRAVSIYPNSKKRAVLLLQEAKASTLNGSIDLAQEKNSSKFYSFDIQTALERRGNELEKQAVEDIENECWDYAANGRYGDLKVRINDSKDLSQKARAKLKTLYNFAGYLDDERYAELINLVTDDSKASNSAKASLDRYISGKLSNDSYSTKQAVLASLSQEALAYFPQLKKMRDNLNRGSDYGSGSKPTKDHPEQQASPVVVAPRPTPSPTNPMDKSGKRELSKIQWVFCENTEDYKSAYERETNPNASNKAPKRIIYSTHKSPDALKTLLGCLESSSPTPVPSIAKPKKDALESSFVIVCNDNGETEKALVNLERFQDQRIPRSYLTIQDGTLEFKSVLCYLLPSTMISTAKSVKVYFSWEIAEENKKPKEGEKPEEGSRGGGINNVKLSCASQLESSLASREDIRRKKDSLETAFKTASSPEKIAMIQQWLGKAGPVFKLFSKNDSLTLASYLKDKQKAKSDDLSVLLQHKEAPEQSKEYIREAFASFRTSKGDSRSSKWTDENASDTRTLENFLKPREDFTEFFKKAAKLKNIPPEVQKIFKDEAPDKPIVDFSKTAAALDALLNARQEQLSYIFQNDQREKDLKAQIERYQDLSKGIKFLAIPEGGDPILTLTIEPPTSTAPAFP